MMMLFTSVFVAYRTKSTMVPTDPLALRHASTSLFFLSITFDAILTQNHVFQTCCLCKILICFVICLFSF